MSSPEPEDRPPEGMWLPPGDQNPNPHPGANFFDWGYLPPTSVATGEPPVNCTYTPKMIIRSRVDQPEAWIVNHSSSTTQSKLHLPPNANRDIVELGPENPWKPCKEWEDSRQKYPMGSIFPMPRRGWTNSEKDDFIQAVKDHWKPLPPNESDREWVADELWRFREQEKCTYWNKYKKSSSPGSGNVAGSGEQGLNRASEIHAHLMLNMQLGGWPEWEYREVERRDSSEELETSSASSAMNTPPTTGYSSIMNTPSTTGYSSIADIPSLPPLPPSSTTTAGVETSPAHASLSVPTRDSAGRGGSGRGGRGRGRASPRGRG